MAMQWSASPTQPEDRIRPGNRPPAHAVVLDYWRRNAERLKNRTYRILRARQMRRGLLKVPIDPLWQADNKALREWVETCLPERKLLDLNLSNVLGERWPEFDRIPLGTTDQAIEDGEMLTTWGQSAFDASVDLDAVIGLLVQDGEFGALVMPSRAGPETPPEYIKTTVEKGGLRLVVPNPQYDRDEKGRAPKSKKGYSGRDEKKSREAYDEAHLRWLAEHPLWYTRLIDATDCIPIMVRGRGTARWEPRGLLIRTLYDRDDLLDEGFEWKSMGENVLVPLDFDAGRTYGNGGQIYLYEFYLMVADPKRPGHKKPMCIYSVGGEETWEKDSTGNQRAVQLDFAEEFGITERFWGYFYGLHLEEGPDWRGVPFIDPLINTMQAHELMGATIRAAAYENSFTGYVEEVNPNLPKEAILEGFNKFRTTPKPKVGQTVKSLGPVKPWSQARVGDDAIRVWEMDRQSLDQNTPDAATTGGGVTGAQSGHALVVGEKLLRSGKRQIGRGVLEFSEFVLEQILRQSCAAMAGTKHSDGRVKTPGIPVPVFVTEEEQLDDGETNEHTSVLQLDERWVGGQYKMKATFPEEGNMAEVDLMRSLAKDGFATDEDVDKARGIKNTILAQVKRAIYRWRQSETGAMEIDMRAAQYQGNATRQKLLALVAASKATPKGGPTAAIDPNVPGTAVLGGNRQPAAPGGGGGGGQAMVTRQRAGIEGGQIGASANARDAAALAQVG